MIPEIIERAYGLLGSERPNTRQRMIQTADRFSTSASLARSLTNRNDPADLVRLIRLAAMHVKHGDDGERPTWGEMERLIRQGICPDCQSTNVVSGTGLWCAECGACYVL